MNQKMKKGKPDLGAGISSPWFLLGHAEVVHFTFLNAWSCPFYTGLVKWRHERWYVCLN